MNWKQIVGIVVIIGGIVLLGYGFYGRSEMAKARGDIDSATGLIPANPITGIVKKELHGKVDQYKVPVALCFIGGAVLIVGGGVLLVFCRNKK